MILDRHGCVELDDDHVGTRVDLDGLGLTDACNELLIQIGISWIERDRCVEPDLVDGVILACVEVFHIRHTREPEPDLEVVIRSDLVAAPHAVKHGTRVVTDREFWIHAYKRVLRDSRGLACFYNAGDKLFLVMS